MADGLIRLLGGLLSPPRATNSVNKSWALNQQGIWAYEKKDWFKAREKFAEASRLDPTDSVIKRNLANTWAWIADDALKTYDYRRAIASLREALNADPSLQDNRDWLNRLEKQLNDDELAARQRAEKEQQDRLTAERLRNQTGGVLSGLASASSDASVVDLRFMGNKPLIVDPTSVSGKTIDRGRDIPSKIAEPAVILPSLEQRMDETRKEIAGLQEALRRIDKSGKLNEQERVAWQKEIDDAGKRALQHGIDMLPGLIVEAAGERVTNALKEKADQIQSTMDKRISALDPGSRSELDGQIKALNAERELLQGSENSLKIAEIKLKEMQVQDIATSNDPDIGRKVLAAHMALTEALGNPNVQKALQISGEAGKKYAGALAYGKDAVDSVFDVASQLVALKKMNMDLNTSSEQYLATVNNLSNKLCQAGSKLVVLKKEAGLVPPETKEATCAR